MRLNKYISETGICSRREADALIPRAGSPINGVRAELGTQVGDGDEVSVDGARGRHAPQDRPPPVYIALNKPVGITCTTERHVGGNIVDLRRPPRAHLPDRPARQGLRGPDPADQRRRHRQRGAARRARPREGVRGRASTAPITDEFLDRDGARRAHPTRRPSRARSSRSARRLPDRADPGPQPPDPPHVRGVRLRGRRAAARAHHAHRARRAEARAWRNLTPEEVRGLRIRDAK